MNRNTKFSLLCGATLAACLSACAAPKANSWSIFTGHGNNDEGHRFRLVSHGNMTDRLGVTLTHDVGATPSNPNDFSSHYTQIRPIFSIVDIAEGRYRIGAMGMLETFPGKDSVSRGGGVVVLPLEKGVLQLRLLSFRDGIDEGRYDLFYRRNFGIGTVEGLFSYRNGELGEKWNAELTPTLNVRDYGVGVHLKINEDRVIPYFAIERRF